MKKKLLAIALTATFVISGGTAMADTASESAMTTGSVSKVGSFLKKPVVSPKPRYCPPRAYC